MELPASRSYRYCRSSDVAGGVQASPVRPSERFTASQWRLGVIDEMINRLQWKQLLPGAVWWCRFHTGLDDDGIQVEGSPGLHPCRVGFHCFETLQSWGVCMVCHCCLRLLRERGIWLGEMSGKQQTYKKANKQCGYLGQNSVDIWVKLSFMFSIVGVELPPLPSHPLSFVTFSSFPPQLSLLPCWRKRREREDGVYLGIRKQYNE